MIGVLPPNVNDLAEFHRLRIQHPGRWGKMHRSARLPVWV